MCKVCAQSRIILLNIFVVWKFNVQFCEPELSTNYSMSYGENEERKDGVFVHKVRIIKLCGLKILILYGL